MSLTGTLKNSKFVIINKKYDIIIENYNSMNVSQLKTECKIKKFNHNCKRELLLKQLINQATKERDVEILQSSRR